MKNIKTKLNILVVDDSLASLKLLGKILQKEKYEPELCISPLEAWELFKQKKFHIVILDIMMPEMNGFELLELIKDYDTMAQVFLVTSDVTMSSFIRALELGAVDFIPKPIEHDKVILAIKECEAKLVRWKKLMMTMTKRAKEKV